jgi:hypothetical protein
VSRRAHGHVPVIVAVLSLLTACTSSVENDAAEPPCVPSTLVESGTGLAEVRGEGAEAWALLWQSPPWTVDQAVKVVWRMPGSGDLNVSAVGPEGEIIKPLSGPTRHLGSNWERPGDEWGTFFALPSEGCWRMEVRRSDAISAVSVAAVTG